MNAPRTNRRCRKSPEDPHAPRGCIGRSTPPLRRFFTRPHLILIRVNGDALTISISYG